MYSKEEVKLVLKSIFHDICWLTEDGAQTLDQMFLGFSEATLKIQITFSDGYEFFIEYFSNSSCKRKRKQAFPATEEDFLKIINSCNVIATYMQSSGEGELVINRINKTRFDVLYLPLLDACMSQQEIVYDIDQDTKEWLSPLFNDFKQHDNPTNPKVGVNLRCQR